MKLSILYESRNPKQPTDLSLVAMQSTKDGARRGKYPVNFYSGKIGKKSSGKVVLGYHDKDDKFRTTGPIVGIVQSKKAPDRWLIKTENNGPYYYSIQMPEATVMSTYNRYLKGTASTRIPIYAYDQNTKKHINKKDAGKIANQEDWSYYNGTTISKSNMPTRKPKTSVEAYDYLMYWAYHNHGGNSLAATSNYDDLIEILSNRKRLSKSINDIVAAFPNAKEAVVKKLKNLAILNPAFELNLDDDSGVPKDEEPEATPAPAPEPKPKTPLEPAQKPTPDLFPDLKLTQAELSDLEQEIEAEVARLTASLQETDPESTLSDRSVADHDKLQTELSDLEKEIARLTTSLEGDPASANTANIIKELQKCLTKLTALQAQADAVQDTAAEGSSALDQDTQQGPMSDSDSVEMPATNSQRAESQEASPEVVALNTKKFTKLLMKMFEMDPETYPNRLRKVIKEFLELRHEPAKWGKCFVDDQDSDLVYRLEDYERLCMVKAFWSGDNRKSNERRELEWPKMDQKMKAFVNSLRHNIDTVLADSKEKLKAALKILINKIRQIDKNF
jgi:hypothetical protein